MKEISDDTTDVQSEWQRFLKTGVESGSNYVSRRGVLRTGVLASSVVLGGGALTGNVVANESNDYGNKNGLGAFLNEKALGKDLPIWDSGIADMTGKEGPIKVEVGTMTSLDIPEDEVEDPPEEGPFGYSPRVVEVSPGTTVRWKWTENSFEWNPDGVPWPHDVHSLDDDPETGEHLFHSGLQGTGDFDNTFEETGSYLYYCTPHGNPGPEHPNIFGMRGAVIVTDD